MPVYPSTPSFRFYFHDNVVVNGRNDREYSAKEMRKPYDTIYSDGIKPDADGTAGNELKVTAIGGMSIAVAKGYAKVGGAYCENESAYNITLDAAGSADRYDCVILRNDDGDEVRDGTIYIRSLTAKPTANNLTRSGGIYELCLAYILVPAFATAITSSNITDTREDGQLCNVMSGVGATVVRTFRNTVYSDTAGQKNFLIGIPQFDESRDQITVLVNGRILPAPPASNSYSVVSKWTVALDLGLPVVGTRVDFIVIKSVNAKGAETVVQEVAFLQDEVAAVKKHLEHHYYCNGQTDNVNISNIIKTFLAGGDYGSIDLKVHGHFGAVSAAAGSGESTNAFKWFDFSVSNPTRRATVDFTDCSTIAITPPDGTYNIVFHGDYIRIVGANVMAQNSNDGTNVRVFSSAKGEIFADRCRFWITGYAGSNIAECGTFKNCRASVTNATGHSYCFTSASTTLLRIEGGEYYAYTASSAHFSAIVGLTSGVDAVAILSGVNAPTAARGGYYQTHAIYQTNGIVNCRDLISALTLNVVSGQSNIQGTIAKNKAGLM